MIVKRIGPLSCAKITGTLYTIVGLFIGTIISIAAVLGGFASARPGGALLGAFLGVGAVIVVPLFYGGLGFIVTLIMAALFNGIVKIVGGVEIEVE
jgi:hypothetical protein